MEFNSNHSKYILAIGIAVVIFIFYRAYQIYLTFLN